jgi:class 3 adenylate cyclase
LAAAESLLETDRALGAKRLEALTKKAVPPAIRVQALSLLAIRSAAAGHDDAIRDAESMLSTAAACRTRSPVALARLAHARGYLAYHRGDRRLTLAELNRAASLYPKLDRRRAEVFDTLGVYFQRDLGDLERSRAYFELSLHLKRRSAEVHGIDRERRGIAITYGNLGRLELSRECFEEAEHWFREDLDLILDGNPTPPDEAFVRNQLAIALMGRGPEHLDDARAELDRALETAREGSVTHAYVLKDLGRLHLEKGDLKKASQYLKQARKLCEQSRYSEVILSVKYILGRVATVRAKTATDSHTSTARSCFNEASSGFLKLSMWREYVEVAEASADMLEKVGRRAEAVRILLETAIPTAERHLFNQRQPLARIASKLDAMNTLELMRLRTRRMLGGLTREQHHGRVHVERARITVWTCDIRGFARYCEETGDPMLIVDMLNRFFAALGRPILDNGGRIDKYVGDNILAYFHDATSAAGVALAAIDMVDQLNTEREHLHERILKIGIGLATGDVVTGNVGFAGKLEHTIIGPTVNRACRLVGKAPPGAILIDRTTREMLGESFNAPPVRGKTLALHGLGDVEAFRLKGRSGKRR